MDQLWVQQVPNFLSGLSKCKCQKQTHLNILVQQFFPIRKILRLTAKYNKCFKRDAFFDLQHKLVQLGPAAEPEPLGALRPLGSLGLWFSTWPPTRSASSAGIPAAHREVSAALTRNDTVSCGGQSGTTQEAGVSDLPSMSLQTVRPDSRASVCHDQ